MIDLEKIVWDEKLTTSDFLDALDEGIVKERMLLKIKLLVKKLKEPVINLADIMAMELVEFNKLLAIFNKKYELDFLG